MLGADGQVSFGELMVINEANVEQSAEHDCAPVAAEGILRRRGRDFGSRSVMRVVALGRQ